jgi:Reductase C-terminal
VWATGDVARWGKLRHEHWTSAVEQARAVAHNISAPHDLVGSASDGYVWSDQYSWKIQLAGETGPHLACEIVGGEDDVVRSAALYRDAAGRLVGIATVNWPKAFIGGRRALGAIDAAEHAAALRGASASVPVAANRGSNAWH